MDDVYFPNNSIVDGPLEPSLTQRVLDFLGVSTPPTPSVEGLNILLDAYTQCVPWESASRIVRRRFAKEIEDCPVWPPDFWQSAMMYGTGGTCYESNLAWLALLRSLGYEGYLTINDMHDEYGVHAATIVVIDGQPWLADTGYPVYCAVPIKPNEITQATSPYHTFTLTPKGQAVYELTRDRHPKPYCYTLLNTSVASTLYQDITTQDYGPNGLFLNMVNLVKVIDGVQWRFYSGERPYHLQQFLDGQRIDHPFEADDDIAAVLGHKFSIQPAIVRSALDVVEALD